jgi:hypothetical protein
MDGKIIGKGKKNKYENKQENQQESKHKKKHKNSQGGQETNRK